MFHTDEPGAFASQILAALDDAPIIEKMYVVGADKTANGSSYPVYIVAKVKEYLLADVEISSMTNDNNPVFLTEFESEPGHYKPYYKFDVNKAFLKERPDPNLLDKDDNPITLYPGEFYARVELSGNEAHTINLTMKNPADKVSEPRSITIQRPIITNEQPTGTISEPRPIIQARISSPLGIRIDQGSIEMKLDGITVNHTPSEDALGINIQYAPTSDLNQGTHIVTLNGRDINGLPAIEKDWVFQLGAYGYWEETWEGANFRITDSYQGRYKSVTYPRREVTGNHYWDFDPYDFRAAGQAVGALGSYVAWDIDFFASSYGVNYEVEARAKDIRTDPNAPGGSNVWIASHYLYGTFNPLLRRAGESQLIWKGGGATQVELCTLPYLDSKPKVVATTPGVYSLENFGDFPICQIVLRFSGITVRALVPRGTTGEDYKEGSVNTYYGHIVLTNVR